MTKRELGGSLATLAIGLLLGALLYRHCASAKPDARVPSHDEPVAEADPPESAEPLGPLGEASTPAWPGDVDQAAPEESLDARTDSGPGRGLPRGAHLRLKNLYIHPVADDRLCVNVGPGSAALELLACRGHKGTERWTFVEDPSGTSRIRGSDDGCWRLGPPDRRGETTIELAACGTETPRFRHREDRRLEEVHSGQCVTAGSTKRGAPLVLAVCDPNARSFVQTWALTP